MTETKNQIAKKKGRWMDPRRACDLLRYSGGGESDVTEEDLKRLIAAKKVRAVQVSSAGSYKVSKDDVLRVAGFDWIEQLPHEDEAERVLAETPPYLRRLWTWLRNIPRP